MKTKSTLRSFLLATGSSLLAVSSASAQSWSGGTNGDWLTTTNWTGGTEAGSTTSTDTDIAVFNVATQPTIGINMTTAGGNYYLGAIDSTNATARIIQNTSGTTGVLTLNGATVNAVANTILRNSTTTGLTIGNSATGTLGLALGNATTNVIQTTSTGGITINSIISGVGGITKQGGGDGVLTLAGNNTYAGVTAINAGRVTLTNANGLGATGVGNHTTINTNGTTTTGGNLVATGVTTAEAITITGTTESSGFNPVLSGNGTFSGPITFSGSGGIRISATLSGTITNTTTNFISLAGSTITNTATFDMGNGDLQINGGTTNLNVVATNVSNTRIVQNGVLVLGVSNALKSTGTLTIGGFGGTDQGTVSLNGTNQTIGALIGSATGANRIVRNNHATVASTLTVGNGGGTGSYNGTIVNGAAATLALTKTGAGTQTLTGTAANTYTGVTTINGGILALSKTDGIDAIAGNITIGDGTGNDILRLGVSNQIAGTAVISFNAATGTDAGIFRLNGFSESVAGISSTGGGGIIENESSIANGTLTVLNTASQSFSGILRNGDGVGTDGTLSLVKFGGGQTLTLSGNNSYSGTTNIGNGTLSLTHVNALGNTSAITISGGFAATLNVAVDGMVIDAPITTGNLGINSNIAFGIGSAAAASLTLDGAIGGAGNVVFTTPNVSSGGLTQTFNLGAAGTWAGSTTMTTGNANNTTLVKNTSGAADVLPTDTVLTMSGGAGAGSGRTVTFDLNGQNQTLAGLTNTTAADRDQRVTSATAATLTINNSAPFTFGNFTAGADGGDGLITGAIALTKAGVGTFTLLSSHTYTGVTTVTGGTLKLGANNVIPDVSNVTIGAATLDADTRTDTAGTLDVTNANSVINLGTGAALAFANSSGVTSGVWAGALNITGTFVAGNDVDPGLGVNPGSIRFGTDNTGLSTSQLAAISVNGSGAGTYTLDAFGYLKASGGGPGPVNSFVISAIPSPQTVGTPITGITITAKDASNATATSFTGTVTFGGTGGFTGTSASFVLGELSGVSVTPTVAGSNLTFTVDDDGGPSIGSTTITTIQTQYQAWAGGALFDDDANGDGVDNGLAFLLGATGPNAAVPARTMSESGGNLIMTFSARNDASRGSAILNIQHSSDLGIGDSWVSVPVTDAGTAASGVTFSVTPGSPNNTVTATISNTEATAGKLFGRLKAEETP